MFSLTVALALAVPALASDATPTEQLTKAVNAVLARRVGSKSRAMQLTGLTISGDYYFGANCQGTAAGSFNSNDDGSSSGGSSSGGTTCPECELNNCCATEDLTVVGGDSSCVQTGYYEKTSLCCTGNDVGIIGFGEFSDSNCQTPRNNDANPLNGQAIRLDGSCNNIDIAGLVAGSGVAELAQLAGVVDLGDSIQFSYKFQVSPSSGAAAACAELNNPCTEEEVGTPQSVTSKFRVTFVDLAESEYSTTTFKTNLYNGLVAYYQANGVPEAMLSWFTSVYAASVSPSSPSPSGSGSCTNSQCIYSGGGYETYTQCALNAVSAADAVAASCDCFVTFFNSCLKDCLGAITDTTAKQALETSYAQLCTSCNVAASECSFSTTAATSKVSILENGNVDVTMTIPKGTAGITQAEANNAVGTLGTASTSSQVSASTGYQTSGTPQALQLPSKAAGLVASLLLPAALLGLVYTALF